MNEKKRRFLQKDRIIKGIHNDGFFKVSVVKTTQSVEEARNRHHLSPLASVLLGKALTGAMLLASELKGEERLQLRFEGTGPIGHVTVEANKLGELRGYVGDSNATIDPTSQKLEDGLGIGLLQATKVLYNQAKPKHSTVELLFSDISRDLQFYLQQSEQVDSLISIDIDFNEDGSIAQSGGLIIQMLPDAPTKLFEQLTKQFSDLPRITTLFKDEVMIDEIMEEVTGKLDVRELERYPVDFYCRCSKDRFADALALLAVDELEAMQDKEQEMICHYCNEKYTFSEKEISRLVAQAKTKLN
jgi:molecular chaperone Hsp33